MCGRPIYSERLICCVEAGGRDVIASDGLRLFDLLRGERKWLFGPPQIGPPQEEMDAGGFAVRIWV